MSEAFSSVTFAEPDRARATLAQIQQRLPAALFPALPALLQQVPDPDAALNYLERFLSAEPEGTARALAHLERNPTALLYLLVVFSYSRFLSETLVQQPELIAWLHRPGQRNALERLKTVEDLHEEFARFEATAFEQPPAVVLARFKRREYLRIMLRDVLGIASLADTTLELSRLADVLLDRARRMCEQRLTNAYGSPQYTDSAGRLQTAQLAVISLGKLGAEELNYSSDIDLMFLYTREGETSGARSGGITNAEYFVRLAQAILKLITEITPEGAVFRVDLRLRPQGAEGDVAVSLPAALDYYQHGAREWEWQMLIKARCSCGEGETVRQFLREMRPLIYRPEFNLAAVEAVLNAREEITRELRRKTAGVRPSDHGASWNVKLSPGGIRDIEFLTQCLQRVYGGQDPWLAVPSTLVGLQRLHDKGFLSGRDFHRLAAAYESLRRVEHRLQLRDGLQRHTLPEAPDALDRLARRCGIDTPRAPGRELLRHIAQHFEEVREIYTRILAVLKPRAEEQSAPAVPQPPGTPRPLASPAPGSGDAEAREGGLMRRLRAEYPAVARAVAEVSARSDAFARRGLHRFLSSAALEREVMAALESHPAWLHRAADAFSRSDLLVDMLARNPEEIPVLADPGLAAFRGPLVAASGDFAQGMAALRGAYRRSVLATLLRGLTSHSVHGAEPYATFDMLTRLAEEALAGAVHLAARDVFGEMQIGTAPFAVVALGRLGTQEMDIGSDADLLFVVDDGLSPDERENWRRLAERLVHVASSHTRDGLLFPVDTRLRPRGTEGEMLQGIASLCDYFRGEAQGWEAATYLKARPVAGNVSLGARAIAAVHAVLRERFHVGSEAIAELAAQLVHTRERLEKEGTGARAKGEFKKVSGGFYDIEYTLAFLLLTRGVESIPPAPAARQAVALQVAGVLSTEQALALRNAATLYRAIDHAMRVVTGRPAHRLPESALADRITALLHQWGIPIESGLEDAVVQARREMRALYEKALLTARA